MSQTEGAKTKVDMQYHAGTQSACGFSGPLEMFGVSSKRSTAFIFVLGVERKMILGPIFAVREFTTRKKLTVHSSCSTL